MKATQESLSKEYHESGAWSDVPLDELFRQTAAEHPDRLALVDAPDRSTWTGGAPRQLSYAEADQEIDRLAAFYSTVGLTADHVIGVQAPNTVDTVIAVLAALRADLIVSPLPLHWRQKNVLEALNSIGAKGLHCRGPRGNPRGRRGRAGCGRGPVFPALCLRSRQGCAGRADRTWADAGRNGQRTDLQFSPSERPDPADHTATICWSRSGEENVPVTRCHNHWVAAAQMVVHEAHFKDGGSLVLPYSLSGLTGLGGGLVPWLLTGGTLASCITRPRLPISPPMPMRLRRMW